MRLGPEVIDLVGLGPLQDSAQYRTVLQVAVVQR